MIVCICRNIRDSDYDTPEEVRSRVMMDDYVCGTCQLQYTCDSNPVTINSGVNTGTHIQHD